MKKTYRIFSAICLAALMLTSCGCSCGKKEVKMLLLPHFEIDELTGDFPGEAQLFYEKYLTDSKTYRLSDGNTLYYNAEDKIAMCITGSGKVNCTEATTCVLSDTRFDWSDAYVMAVGCAGGAMDYSTLGDVCIATAVCDNDLGHTADIRDLSVENNTRLWYHDSSFDDVSFKRTNSELTQKCYELTKDTVLETTDLARTVMSRNFPDAEWAARDPKVITGVHLTSDNYWKGEYNHLNTLEIIRYYFGDEPFAMTEMEDISVIDVAERFGLKDRCILLRVNVNPDVFIDGDTPESLWAESDFAFNDSVDEENKETLDIFEPAMRNCFAVGSVIIDALLAE